MPSLWRGLACDEDILFKDQNIWELPAVENQGETLHLMWKAGLLEEWEHMELSWCLSGPPLSLFQGRVLSGVFLWCKCWQWRREPRRSRMAQCFRKPSEGRQGWRRQLTEWGSEKQKGVKESRTQHCPGLEALSRGVCRIFARRVSTVCVVLEGLPGYPRQF